MSHMQHNLSQRSGMKLNLDIRNKSKFEGRFPTFQKPVILGHFCMDSERSYCSDVSQLKYLFPHPTKDLKFDLNHGIEKTIKKDDSAVMNERIDNMLKWILHNSNKLERTPENNLAIDFVCFRGLLTAIMNTPYENQEGWIICATKFRGTIYLCAFETNEKRHQRETATEQQKRFCTWGFKFEQYMLSDKPGTPPNLDEPVNENEEFCCMFRSRLNSFSLLYGAEMDGLDVNCKHPVAADSKDIAWTSMDFVELKTSRQIQNRKQDQNFKRFKLIKWWIQSFLVGIKSIVCGLRDDHGFVHNLKRFQVSDLPKMAKGLWDPCVCANFCCSFLQHVKSIVTVDDPNIVWKFEWRPRQDVTVTKLEGSLEFTFLPLWFTQNLNQEGK